jgi:hypothetical protein
MDQLKAIIDVVQRFSVPEKEITAGQNIGIQMLHHLALGIQVEVDEYIAAEDKIDTLEQGHSLVVVQIDAIEAND